MNEAQDVEELGILLMGASTFDVIVADLGTPRSSGVAFIAELRSQGNTTPIVLLSDDASDVRHSLRRSDGVLVVGKPSTPSALKQAVLASVRIPPTVPSAARAWRNLERDSERSSDAVSVAIDDVVGR